ncbi:MAG: transcription elongation factor GreB [Deltaproteobacteria bacterium]|nr:transcription elongation factor GreB [Deltaproteobacteria bacterium]
MAASIRIPDHRGARAPERRTTPSGERRGATCYVAAAPAKQKRRAEVAGQSNYITRPGFENLRAELDWLWREERPRVTEAVATAAALGDRSENADYIYGKKRLREIDRRIRFLTKRIDELTVVDGGERKDPERIYFGAWVTLEDEEGEEHRYQLVGPDEFDAKQGRISVDSPVGRALMGKRIGDEVMVRRPRGEVELTVLAVEYV